MSKNIVAFIPARSGSKGIAHKNIKKLGDKPLIEWSIDSAFKAGVSRVVVSTDSAEYAKIAKAAGAEVLMRPSSLAGDKTSMLDVLKSEIPKIEGEPELILLLQPTTPFRKKVQIKAAISYLTTNRKDYDSLIAVEKLPDKYNPYHIIVAGQNGTGMLFRRLEGVKEWFKGLFTGKKFVGPNFEGYPINKRMVRRQDFPQSWVPTGAVYLFAANNLRHGSIYGRRTMLLETESTININSPDDWKSAEAYLTKLHENE